MNPRNAIVPALLFAWGILPTLTFPASGATRPDWGRLLGQPGAWYASAEAANVVEGVLSHQCPAGDWPKNTDTTRPFTGDPSTLRGTFDNGATLNELRFLARTRQSRPDPRIAEAVRRGVRHVLDAQYPSGGWPQSHPPGSGYARHITFNDDTMVRLLRFTRELPESPDFAFLPADIRARAHPAFERGIECILDCQIRVHGDLTVWCAQHDAVTFAPRPARSYELVSLSGAESASILRLLMSLPSPSPRIRAAIHAGARWFERARLDGLRVERREGNKVIVPDPTAPPLWARFYEIHSNRPMFCGRDGIARYDLALIEAERRNGYAWHGTWGADVARDFAAWKSGGP